jgi:hypothetical protein
LVVAEAQLSAKKYANDARGKAERASDEVALHTLLEPMRTATKEFEKFEQRQNQLKRGRPKGAAHKRARKAAKQCNVRYLGEPC